MRWLKVLLGLLAAGVALILLFLVVVFAVGLSTPVDHVASARASYTSSQDELWAVVADVATWPEWNPGFDTMERGEDRDGKPYWVANGPYGQLPLVVDVFEPPTRMVTRIPDDAEIGFTGTWTYLVEPAGSGAAVTMTEAGSVPSVFFRGIGGLFWDNHTGISAYLADLGKRVGEEVSPVKVE